MLGYVILDQSVGQDEYLTCQEAERRLKGQKVTTFDGRLPDVVEVSGPRSCVETAIPLESHQISNCCLYIMFDYATVDDIYIVCTSYLHYSTLHYTIHCFI